MADVLAFLNAHHLSAIQRKSIQRKHAPAHTAPKHSQSPVLASAQRGTFERSLVYSGSAALIIAGAGLLLLASRRRLW
jgi:hypothetical protein